ncbi:Sialic acid-binding Ig-like lectin 11 [Sciurus carolinensis]|uniref:Sialic acid-binding Ig-like lectin 11 n=1 Tax=Sciurus carolinensis TaxID=30640 RepID=A0AA41T403_SCICA|nr:Sialic acid-binding Ig-like lectin 11 [Sciurus carolinensis]
MLLLALLLFQLRAGSLRKVPSYWLQVQELVTVQEGLCVLVPCAFHSEASRNRSTLAHGYWYKKKENSKIDQRTDDLVATNNPDKEVKMKNKLHFLLLGDPQADNCSLSISGVQKAHSGRYYFRLEKGTVKYNYRSNLLTLIVTGLTQTPDIHIREPLQSGHLSHVTCSMPGTCDWPMAPNISWAGAALRALGSGLEPSTASEILLTPNPQDHGTHLTCRVTFPGAGVSSERTVQLSVSYAPQNLTISIPTAGGPVPESQGNVSYLEVQKGQFLRLLCTVDSHPPATLSWVLEDRVLSWSCSSGPRTLELELPTVRPGDSGRYTCQAENGLGSQRGTLDLSVQYPPEDLRVTVSQENRTVLEVIRNGTSLPVLEGQSLRLVCVAHSHPPARLSWTWGPQTLSPEWPSDPGVLELPWVQTEHEGEFTCHARSPLGAQHISLSLSVHYPPRLLGPSCSWEARALRCSCSSRAWPAPSLHWRLGEGLLEGNSSNASLRVTSSSAGPWANSSLSLHEGVSSGLRLSCEAQNAHGTQSATVLLLPGKAELRGGALLGTLGAAGGAALLFCTCLIFFL